VLNLVILAEICKSCVENREQLKKKRRFWKKSTNCARGHNFEWLAGTIHEKSLTTLTSGSGLLHANPWDFWNVRVRLVSSSCVFRARRLAFYSVLKCLHVSRRGRQRELWPQIFKTQFRVFRSQIPRFLAPNRVLLGPIFFCSPPVALKRTFSRQLLRFLVVKIYRSCVLWIKLLLVLCTELEVLVRWG
jgi:hypothetical protein